MPSVATEQPAPSTAILVGGWMMWVWKDCRAIDLLHWKGREIVQWREKIEGEKRDEGQRDRGREEVKRMARGQVEGGRRRDP